MLQRVQSLFSFEIVLSHSTETFHRGTLLCCVSENILVAKKFMDKREGEVSRFSFENFLSHSNGKILREHFCAVFQKISGSETVYGLEGRGGKDASITNFCRKLFVSHCRKTSYGNHSVLCFRKFPVAKKFMDKKGEGEYQDFPWNFFCLTRPKIFVGETFGVSLVSGIEKIYASEG